MNKAQHTTRYINKLAVSGLRWFELLIKLVLNCNVSAIKCQSIHIATVTGHIDRKNRTLG